MKFSRVSAVFLAILILSLGVKIGLRHLPTPLDPVRLEQAIVSELARRGYSVSVGRRSWGPLVYGRRAGCRVLIVQRAPDGFTKDRIAELASPVGALRYVYRGHMTAEPPGLEPFVRDRVISQLQQFGIRAWRSPVLAVAASPQCNLQEIDWSRLASVG